MSEPIFIGIDGGGTNCRVRIRSADGSLIGEGVGGAANARLGPNVVWNSILTACRKALEVSGASETDLRHAHVGLGLAGATQNSARDCIRACEHPFATLAVESDAYIAWLGAFGEEDGAIVIVGTGSCGYGVVGGRATYVGGWGFEVSDEGSGMSLGREALRRSIWAYDGRLPTTPLAQTLLSRFGGSPEAVVDFVGQARPRDYAGLAPLVLHHAGLRDPLGLDLVRDAARAIDQIGFRLLDIGAPSLCLVGGLSEPLRPWLSPPLRERIVRPLADPLDGAILLARRQTSNEKAENC